MASSHSSHDSPANPRTPGLVTALLAAAIGVSLSGCGTPGGIPPNSTVSQVRDRAGLPTDIRFDANGDELWEYARGPAGTETYLVRVDRSGKVKDVTQLLTRERFERIVPGRTTKIEARDLLGRPSDVAYLRSGPVWEWRVYIGPEFGHYALRFDDNGNVVREKMVLTDPVTDDGKGDSQ